MIKVKEKGRKEERITWFVACYIEREKKRKQIKCQVSSSNSRLTWESEKERNKERKKESCDLLLATSKQKRKESRQVSSRNNKLAYEL